MDSEKVMSWLEGLAEPDWRDFHSDSEVQNIAKSALELLKAQRETIDELISADKALKLLKEQETEWEHLLDAPDGTYKGRCKKCGFVHFFIENHDGQYRFCPSCGKAVK